LRRPRIKWRDQIRDDIQEAAEKYYTFSMEGRREEERRKKAVVSHVITDPSRNVYG
jgi:hypothetical protein